ncbi:MAG: trehalose-6-phosphate synthase [Acidimicrobiia bacterium]
MTVTRVIRVTVGFMASDWSLIVVANRLAVAWDEEAERWRAGPGGLVSSLNPILQKRGGTWIGWTGTAGGKRKPFDHQGVRQLPVRLSRADIRDYYEGFCNGTIWPLYHDVARPAEIHRRWWRAYVEVNQRFADAAAETASDGDVVWVQDYQLQLVPRMLRDRLASKIRIGFFLHIPFPPVELFERLPWRKDLLEGLLGSDVIGFQTHLGVINFGRAARTYTDARGSSELLKLQDRKVRVGATPISIDFNTFSELADQPRTVQRSLQLRSELGNPEIVILGVDRLDYTKGIDHRLRAFSTLLQRRRDLRGRIVFVQIAVPTRENVEQYQAIRDRIELIVGRINGQFGHPGWAPIYYQYRSVDRAELVAYYRMADVAVITPLRDGMNLVAKEYLASRTENSGVLVLSEFAGASEQLREALIVNPYDLDGLAATLERAVELSEDEQRRRLSSLRRRVRRSDVHAWAAQSLEVIADAGKKRQ